MNENRSINILRWAVALLVFCNLGLVLTIWLKPLHNNAPRPETPQEFVIRNLKFNDDQVKKYDVLVKQHQQDMHRLRDEAKEYRDALFNNLKNGYHDNVADSSISTVTNSMLLVDSLVAHIANDQRQIELATYIHFSQVRSLCTNEQKQEFDRIVGDVTKMMGGPGGHRPPPPGGQHGGPPPPYDQPDGPGPQRPGPPPDAQ